MACKSIRKHILTSSLRALIGGTALLLTSCMAVRTHAPDGREIVMSQKEFARYVEHVFRYHNQVMNDLIEAAEGRGDLDARDEKKLSEAELKMVQVCRPLNEVVSESLSGKDIGLETKIELVDTVPACEGATRIVEDLMP